MVGAERRLAAILGGTLALWATDSLHGLPPAPIGLAAATLCLLPRIGMLPPDTLSTINLRICFYIAAVLGLVAVIGESGLGAAIGRAAASWAPLSPESPAASLLALCGIATLLTTAVTANGAPALYTGLAGDLAGASGLPLDAIVMAQVVGFSTIWLPYQAPPIVMASEIGGVGLRDATRLSLAYGAASIAIAWPLSLLWWRAIGVLP